MPRGPRVARLLSLVAVIALDPGVPAPSQRVSFEVRGGGGR